MLARLSIALPFHFTVPDNAQFMVPRYKIGDYEFSFCPIARSDRPAPYTDVEVSIDGKPCFFGDVLRIDFRKEEFDWRRDAPMDPPENLIRQIVGWFCSRARYVTDAPMMSPVDFPNLPWRLEYLNDDGSQLEPKPGHSPGRGALSFRWTYISLTPEIWKAVFELPEDFEPPQWEVLLLDARAAFPSIGQAVVLTATALEVFVSTLLDRLAAKSALSEQLWEWINNRGFFLKNPSTEEQFDVLLRELCGETLKTDEDLWTSLRNLREARNRFVHGGIPTIGGRPVTRDEAEALVHKAYKIVEFVKKRLPEDLVWPKPKFNIQLKIAQSIRVGGPETENAGGR